MKKLFNVLMIVLIALSLVACGNNKSTNIEGSLSDIMDKVYADIPEDKTPGFLEKHEVNADNIEWFLGSKDIEFKEALAMESGIGSYAHSVVLIRANEGQDIEALKEMIKENIDTNKWICVGIDKDQLIVENIGDLVIVIIDNLEIGDTIKTSFENLAK